MTPETTSDPTTEGDLEVVDLTPKPLSGIPLGLIPALYNLVGGPTKGQRPTISRSMITGHDTGRMHVCCGCRRPGGTLQVLFKRVKKPRITLYSHAGCRERGIREMQGLAEDAAGRLA